MKRRKLAAIAALTGLVAFPLSKAKAEVSNSTIYQIQKEIQELKKENQRLQEQVKRLEAAKTGFFAKPAYGAKKGIKVDFYGYIKVDAIYQDAGGVGTTYLLWALPKDLGKGDSYSTITFRQTRFGFIITKPYKTFTLKGRIEMDFYSQSNDVENRPWNPQHAPLRARLAYLEVDKGTWQFRAGQDWMIISQLHPHMLNFLAGSYMGNIGFRTTLIEVTKNIKLNSKDLLKLQVALERPYNFGKLSNDLVIFDNDPNNDYALPGIEARIGYYTKLFNRKAMFAIYGHRSGDEFKKNYQTLSGSLKSTSFSIGMEVTVPIPVLERFSPRISGELWYGQNLGGYYCGGIDQGMKFGVYNGTATNYYTSLAKFNKSTDTLVSVQPIHATGGWVELSFKPTKKLTTYLGWGIDNPDDKDLSGVADARLSQQMVYTDLFYRFVPELATGFEWLHVKTHYRPNFLGGDGVLNRFMLSFFYFF